MKYLKIENNKGYYLKVNDSQEEEWLEIDKITKDDLMDLLNSAINSKFEMDNFVPDNLNHKAHQIIYKNIHEKFTQLLESKGKFKDEADSYYKAAFDKYSKPAEDSEELI